MLKIEISLENYNKLRAKEEILTQLNSLPTPTSDFQSVLSTYKKMQKIIESVDNMMPSEFSEVGEVKIKLSRKVYEYYLNIQMIFGQIENLDANSGNFDSIVQYWNTFSVYRTTFREVVKKKSAEVEEFNTLLKIEKENRILKRKNIELEKQLADMTEDDEDIDEEVGFFEFD